VIRYKKRQQNARKHSAVLFSHFGEGGLFASAAFHSPY